MKIQKAYISWEEFEKIQGGDWTPSAHTHVRTDITDFWEEDFWANIPDKPSTYPPSAHASAHHSGGSDPLAFASITGFGDYLNQAVKTSSSPVFENLTISTNLNTAKLSITNGVTYYLDTLIANNKVPDSAKLAGKEFSEYNLNDLGDVVITTPENGSFLQYFSASQEWKDVVDPAPAPHKASHESGGSDTINHDNLVGFVAAEHLSLPNTIANVLSNHTKAVHDALDINAAYISGDEVYTSAHADGHVLMWVAANSRWENKPVGLSIALNDLTDVVITTPENGSLLQYFSASSEWKDVVDATMYNSMRWDGWLRSSYMNQALLTTSNVVFNTVDANEYYGDNGAQTDPSFTFQSDQDTGLYLYSSNVLGFTTGGALRMRVYSSGLYMSVPIYAKDHGSAATDQVVNVCYGTGSPPAVGDVTEGTLFIKYTA